MALATLLLRESLTRSRFIQSMRSSTTGAMSLLRTATFSLGDNPLIERSRSNIALNFCTDAKAMGDMVAAVLLRAFEVTSANLKKLRLACAQHRAAVIGPDFRPGS